MDLSKHSEPNGSKLREFQYSTCTLYTKKTSQSTFVLSEYSAFLGGHHRRVASTAERGPELVYLSQHFVHPANNRYCINNHVKLLPSLPNDNCNA